MLAALILAGAITAAPVESVLEIPGAPGPLRATILTPAKASNTPAVVILPGSGPTDRNGDNPYGVKAAPYRLLAEGLAAKGVTTLRMDKRGMFASKTATAEPNAVTVLDLAVDANAWAAKLKTETGAKCVWLLGHSEGGLVALIAAQTGKDLCGVVLVATGGRPLADILRQQLRANPANAPLLGPAMQAIETLEAGRKVDTTDLPAPLLPLFNPAVQGFLIVSFKQDPTALAQAYSGPMLILQGSTDLQVTVEDANLLKAAQPTANLVVLESVNHVLKTAPADRAANVATYANPSLPLAPGVVEAIADFVNRR